MDVVSNLPEYWTRTDSSSLTNARIDLTFSVLAASSAALSAQLTASPMIAAPFEMTSTVLLAVSTICFPFSMASVMFYLLGNSKRI